MINPPLKSRSAKALMLASVCAIALCVSAAASAQTAMAPSAKMSKPGRYYLPGVQASKIVTVTREGSASAEVTLMTQAVTVKETGPKTTIDHFGEVYAYSPDDDHDFALLGPDSQILMFVDVPPLKKTSYIFTFHRDGLFDFKCLQHQPEMSGQIMVLPPIADHP
jgi:hypothetical protein